MQPSRIAWTLTLAVPLAACSSEDPGPGSHAKHPPDYALGRGDGSPTSVSFVPVYEPDEPRQPTDLAFNPSRTTELWVVNRLDDSAIIIENPGSPDETSERRRDPAAAHFMEKPPAIAFGAVSSEWGQTFAVCGDDDNSGNMYLGFMGPALFSANLDIFAKQTENDLGSHLDMLHSTSFCRGIAHVDANIYYVYNSQKHSIDKYDFHKDHGPGNDDHSDGEIYRCAAGSFTGIDNVPSHLVFNPDDLQLYIADTGNRRIAKLDTTSGTVGASFSGLEDIAARKSIDNAVVLDVVPAGAIDAPSGIELHAGLLYVTDNGSSRFLVYDLKGRFVRALVTDFPPGSLAGFTFGPEDGKIYFVNMLDGFVYRIDPVPSSPP